MVFLVVACDTLELWLSASNSLSGCGSSCSTVLNFYFFRKIEKFLILSFTQQENPFILFIRDLQNFNQRSKTIYQMQEQKWVSTTTTNQQEAKRL